MNVTCYPAKLRGSLTAIPSKSDAHRKLICAALSDIPSCLRIQPPFCEDIQATIRCLTALGAVFTPASGGLHITPCKAPDTALLDCGESGSTLRFLLPVAACLCGNVSVTGAGRLPQRPLSDLVTQMKQHGVRFTAPSLPLTTTGQLIGGCYALPGNVSSQYLSGLLMALPMAKTDSEIRLTTALESGVYVQMTLAVLRQFGISVAESQENGMAVYRIAGNQCYHAPADIAVDGDWSNAAFYLVSGALQEQVQMAGVSTASLQSDQAVVSIVSGCGAAVTQNAQSVTVMHQTLQAFDADMREIPDLLPILTILAANAEGTSQFTNAQRLRYKECDRLSAAANMIRALGGQVTETEDSLTVAGGGLRGGTVESYGDHRMVMAAAIAATCCTQPVTILGAEAINKSYPSFFADYHTLGGKTDGITIR